MNIQRHAKDWSLGSQRNIHLHFPSQTPRNLIDSFQLMLLAMQLSTEGQRSIARELYYQDTKANILCWLFAKSCKVQA